MNYKIQGAGPAGLAAAIKLAQNGYRAEVFEKNLFVGGNVRTDVQAIRSYGKDKSIRTRLKKDGLKLDNWHPIYRIKKYSPSNRFDLIYSNNDPIFYTVKRGTDYDSMDSELISQAKKEGAKITFGTQLKVSDAHIIAGGSKFNPAGLGFGASYENANFDSESIAFFFGNEYIPHGYGYVTPFKKNYVTISITTFNKTDFPSLKTNFSNFINSNEVIKEILSGARLVSEFSGAGHFNIPKTAIHKHKYFVGGAAGFVDSARGFGLKYAFLSGLFAAESMISNLDYDKLWQDEFKEELYEGYARRLLLDKLKTSDYEQFVKGKEINIEQYAKVPDSLKDTLMNINARINIESLRKKYPLSSIFEL